jgi:hypothetical protein
VNHNKHQKYIESRCAKDNHESKYQTLSQNDHPPYLEDCVDIDKYLRMMLKHKDREENVQRGFEHDGGVQNTQG